MRAWARSVLCVAATNGYSHATLTQDATMWLQQFADGMPSPDGDDAVNINTLDMLSPSSVGGVAWDFPADGSLDYFLQSGNFTLPAGGFAIEMWVSLNSFATTSSSTG
jgi:hypothetical protein